MAVNMFPFNSTDGTTDFPYSSADFREMFMASWTNGRLPYLTKNIAVQDSLQVSKVGTGTSATLKVSAGACFINGAIYQNDSETNISTINWPAGATGNHVLTLCLDVPKRTFIFKFIAKTAVTDNDYVLANITGNSATGITSVINTIADGGSRVAFASQNVAPTSDNNSGRLIHVFLNDYPPAYYNGYIYFIYEGDAL